MGIKNVVTKKYISQNDKFADLCNYFLFHGKTVITITVYWNGGTWDGSRSLHELFDVKHKEILQFIPDYKMNLIVPEEMEDFDKFATELGPVLEYCQCSKDKEKLKKLVANKNKEGFFLSKDAVSLLNACVNAGIKLPKKEGVKVNMCKAMEDLMAEIREESEAKGELKGEARMSQLVNILLEHGKTEELRKVTSDIKLREEYYKRYNI